MTGKPILEYDGRLLIFEFHINEHEHLLLINAYGVVTDSSKVNPNNISKKTLQKEMLDTVTKAKDNFLRRAEEEEATPKIILQGDRQDIITRTEADNISVKGAKKMHDLGLLKWCHNHNKSNLDQGFQSLAFAARPPGEQYITRKGRGINCGGRGIDHIMANKHTECTLAEIDQHAAQLAMCTSDHYLIIADITNQHPQTTPPRNKHT